MLGWVLILSLMAAIGYAQQPPAAAPALPTYALPAQHLSLADALDLAREHNPDYRTFVNDRWVTGAQQRSSLLNLLTPGISASYGARHTQAGTSSFFQGGIAFVQPSAATSGSSWSLNFDYALSGTVLASHALARANAHATDADIAGAATNLETNVRTQYMNLLQARALAALAQRSLSRSQDALTLAQARYAVGQATLIDVRRAEVDSGTAAVNLLTAEGNVTNQQLILYQYLGVPAPDAEVIPTDTFGVTVPAFNENQLIQMALDENPTVRAARARESSAHWASRAAYSEYLPSLNLSASYGGYKQNISALGSPSDSTYRPAEAFSGRNPWQFTLFISMPIYDGFTRAVDIQRARAAEDDLEMTIRRVELNLRAQVTAAYLAMLTAYQKIALQDAAKRAANEALDLATQRYRVGSGTYLELVDARLAADQADANYVTAVYGYHISVASLENAVGRPLR